jgi:formiminotetrahydrofolate cyclodeaminase
MSAAGTLLALPAYELLDRFASAEPTPGGGSASALAGALGAALVSMVCAMEKTRTGAPAERERLDTARGWAREASARLRRLVDEDSEAYQQVLAAYRLPRSTEAETTARKAAIARAMARATEVPRQTAEACLVVLDAAVETATHGNPNALSDARTAGALAWAGLLGAIENVRINLGPRPDGAAHDETRALVERARGRAGELGLPVEPEL